MCEPGCEAGLGPKPLDGDRIAVDLAELLRWRGLGDLVDYLTLVRVTSREGAIVVEFALRVP